MNNQELHLYDVRPEDEGRYICQSYTTGGETSQPSYFDLRVTPGKYNIPLIQVGSSSSNSSNSIGSLLMQ